jgi:hypothetical protein
MTHPKAGELALYIGGDCGPLAKWRIARHLRACEGCRSEADAYRKSREELRQSVADLPAGLNWERLSREMTGNIRVGLAAGACVGDFPAKRRGKPLLQWNIATSMGMLGILFVAAFLVNLPAPQAEHLMSSLRQLVGVEPAARPSMMTATPANAVLEASPQQIQVWSNGTAMTVVPSQTADVTVSLSLQGSASQRVVDGDTGQVTISQVYYAQ